MYAGSLARILSRRAALQVTQATLASYIGSGPYNALTPTQQAAVQAQNNQLLGNIGTMTAKVQRKTGHA